MYDVIKVLNLKYTINFHLVLHKNIFFSIKILFLAAKSNKQKKNTNKNKNNEIFSINSLFALHIFALCLTNRKYLKMIYRLTLSLIFYGIHLSCFFHFLLVRTRLLACERKTTFLFTFCMQKNIKLLVLNRYMYKCK